MLTGFKSRSRSSLVDKSVEDFDTLSTDRSLTKRTSPPFKSFSIGTCLWHAQHSALVWNETRRLRIAGN
jgi:hypothetical protein